MPCSFLAVQIVFVLLAATSTPVIGNTENESESTESSFLLKGRHGISVHAGILGGTTVKSEVTVGTVETEVHENTAIVSLSYAYWVRRDWNVGVGVGILDAEAVTSVDAGEVSSEAAAVTSILFGAVYYPAKLAITSSMRPYGSLAVGPYVGSATNSYVGDDVHSESVSETTLGLRVQAGVDIFFGKRFKAGVVLGYHFVSDFDEQIGSDRNYSGPEFSAGIGILLCKGR